MQGDLFKAAIVSKPITLRGYQREAVDAVYAHLRERDDNPCLVEPTGSGKTPIIATICRDAVTQWGGRVIVLAHVKELLIQSADKLRAICPEVPIGVYSAGMGRRDTRQSIIVAGIQSVYSKACELDAFDLVIVDEAHLIPPDGEGMYRQFLSDATTVNPQLRVIGLTATPYRMKSGLICSPDGILNHVCHETGVRELIVQGYLSPLVSKAGKKIADLTGIGVRGGEYIAEQVEAAIDTAELVSFAVAEIIEQTAERQSCLIFCASVGHAQHVVDQFQTCGCECGLVTGNTSAGDRARLIERFQRGELKYLANVNVLTTGFDAPNVDCVALLRPTLSPGLYYQMVGRGFRLHPGKENCLVLDFGGNVLRHGPVDRLNANAVARAKSNRPSDEAPAKECPNCRAIIATGYCVCPECGHEFPPPERQVHTPTASTAKVLSEPPETIRHEVQDVCYSVHTKRGADDTTPKTFRVDYEVGWQRRISEWVCVEHAGFARRKAEKWWSEHSPDPCPVSAERAVDIAHAGGLAETKAIMVREYSDGGKFPEVVGYELGEIPEPVELLDTPRQPLTHDFYDDDIPF